MKPRKYNNPPPAKSEPAKRPAHGPAAPPAVLTPADEVVVLVAPRVVRRWLRVALTFAPGADRGQAGLAAVEFSARLPNLDRRLRLTFDSNDSGATADEMTLVFRPQRWGVLESGWLDEVVPAVREAATTVKGIELKSVDVVTGA